MSELVAIRVREAATRLGLTHLATNLAELIARADTDQLGYLELLDLVTGEETAAKDNRRYHHALKLAGLPHHKTLDEFVFSFQPDLDVRKVRDLATLTFIETHTNIALFGPPGVGKTHLACSLAVAAFQAGHMTSYTSLDDMVRKLRAADAAGSLNRQIRTYLRPALLVIDEVGYRPLGRADANLVFQVISRRYESSSTIITSNKSFGMSGERSSPTTSSPPPSSTATCTIAKSSASTGPAGDSRTNSPTPTPHPPPQPCNTDQAEETVERH